MANPRASTRTPKPKPAPVERDMAVRIFEVGAHARGRGPDAHFACRLQDWNAILRAGDVSGMAACR